MRKFYLLVTLFCASLSTQAQMPEIRPLIEINPTLQAYAAQKAHRQGEIIEGITGINPINEPVTRSLDDCPDIDNFIVEEGETIFLTIDTFGLGGGTFGDSLIINFGCGSPQFAEEVEIIGSNLRFKASLFTDNADLKDDKVCIDFFQNNGPIIPVEIPVLIRRQGREIQVPSEDVIPFGVQEFCLDEDLIELPGERVCSDIEDNVFDGYDGNGVAPQTFYFWQVHENLCWTYVANAFPETDQVNMTICDEFGICDVFVWNFEVPATVLTPDGNNIFFDDFSNDGLFPKRDLWIEDRVWRNNSVAFEPPSIGTATFDGLDNSGTPYVEENGIRIGDRLTSHPIDLSGFTEDDNVYLKFYLQRKGLGLQPEFVDSFFVEVRNDDGDWQQLGPGVNGFSPIINPFDSEPFMFIALELDDEDLYHNRFQVRFSNVISEFGIMDVWHLDHVRIEADTDASQTMGILGDMAWTERPNSILRNYQSMPWHQLMGFEEQEFLPFVMGTVFNHQSEIQNIDFSQVTITETETGATFSGQFPFEFLNFDPLERLSSEINLEDIGLFNSFIDFIGGISTNFLERRELEIEYILLADQNISFAQNDTVTRTFIFDKYLARDDGSAELQATIGSTPGNEEIGQHYLLNEADTITGVRIMFPRVFSNTQGRQFRIRVYDTEPDDDITPIHESRTETIFFPDLTRQGIQTFSNYRFEDSDGNPIGIPLDAGDFWVTIRELNPTGLSISVGFDRSVSLDSFTNIFINSQGLQDFSSSRGAIMINPVLSGTVFSSSTRETELRQLNDIMTIFPNPASNLVNIHLLDGYYEQYEVEIFNNLGQRVKTFPMSNQFSVEELQSGVYYLKIRNTKTFEIFNHKLIKS